jgi:hypothetical protein
MKTENRDARRTPGTSRGVVVETSLGFTSSNAPANSLLKLTQFLRPAGVSKAPKP